jgi:hypothetical protein
MVVKNHLHSSSDVQPSRVGHNKIPFIVRKNYFSRALLEKNKMYTHICECSHSVQ